MNESIPHTKQPAQAEPETSRPALDDLLALAWQWLALGVHSRTHGFHTPALATIGLHGPEVRTVVLRSVERSPARITAHTDLRSPKCQEIAQGLLANPDVRCAWLFYDAELQAQLRVRTRTRIEAATLLADEHWAAAKPSSRRCYLAPLAPSSVTQGWHPNLPETVRKRAPAMEETTPGRANFALIVSDIERIEFLRLASSGHIRAGFDIGTDGSAVKAEWLAG